MRNEGEEKQELHSMPMSGAGRIQLSATYDSTRSPGNRGSGIIILKEYRVGKCKEKKGLGRETNLKR